jgi:hypothetical protein
MPRLIAIILSSALILQAVPSSAAAPAGRQASAATGTLNGAAVTPTAQPLPNTTVRARLLSTNTVVDTTTSNARGAYAFPGLAPGTYVIEVLSQTGAIIGTSAATSVVAGGTATAAVTATAAAAAGAAAGGAAAAAAAAGLGGAAGGIGLTAAVVVTAVAATAGVTTAVVAARDDPSPVR